MRSYARAYVRACVRALVLTYIFICTSDQPSVSIYPKNVTSSAGSSATFVCSTDSPNDVTLSLILQDGKEIMDKANVSVSVLK